MNARKLTQKQREVFKALSKTPNGIIRGHVKPTGTICFRLLTEGFSPIMNISERVVHKLVDVGVIERNGHNYTLCATVDA